VFVFFNKIYILLLLLVSAYFTACISKVCLNIKV